MNLRNKRCLFGLLTWAVLAASASAQEGNVQLGPNPNGQLPAPLTSFGDVPGQANVGNTFGYTTVGRAIRPRFNIDTRGGGLYGYDPGYTNVGMFVPFELDDDESLIFFDGRGMVTHDNGGGANAGVGWRWWMQDIDRIVGLSAWYDFDNGHREAYHQIGLSFESLGRYVDYRVNGYIPIGTRSNLLSSSVDPNNIVFRGNNIAFVRTNVAEQSFTGFDAELGGPLPVIGRYGVNGYIGGYHFMGNGDVGGSFTGVSGRWQAQINEDLTFGMQVTDDHEFGTNVQFQVSVSLPDGVPSRWLRNPRVQDRLTQSVFRQYRVMTNVDTYNTSDIAINPKDGLPYFVAHIDPNAAAGGNGSINNPFSSVANYLSIPVAGQQSFDMIYVRPRTDDTSTNLDTAPTLTVFNNQRLLSTSVAHTFESTNFAGVTHVLPGFTGGLRPMLFNSSGGDVITIADGAECIEISGFDITGSAGGNGISGTNNGFININRNDIHGGFNGINLVNLIDNGHGPSQIFENTLRENINDGFHLLNIGGPSVTNLELRDNLAFGNGDDGFDIAADAGSTIGGLIDGNSTVPPAGGAANGDAGLSLSSIGGVLAFNTPGTQQISNNNFSNNFGSGVFVDVTAGGTADLLFLGNTLSNNLGSGLHVPASDGSLVNLVIGGPDDTTDRNTISGNSVAGILFDLTNTANGVTATIENNLITGNRDGIQVNVSDTAQFGPGTALDADGSEIFDNEITGNTRDGIRLTRNDAATLDLGAPGDSPIHDNLINLNVENGLTLIANDDAAPPVVLATEDNIFDGNGQDGLMIVANDNTVVNYDSNRDQFINNGRHGLNAIGNDQSVTTINLVNVTADGNVGNGFNSVANDNAVQLINVFSPVDPLFTGTTSSFSNNGGDGMSNSANQTSFVAVNINPLNESTTAFDNNGDDGWNLNRLDASLITATAQNASFSGNGNDGIEFSYGGSPPTDPNQPFSGTPNTLTLTNIVADGNGNNGLNAIGAGDAMLVATVTTSQFNNNAVHGVNITNELGSFFGESVANRSVFDNVTIVGNTQDGIHVDENSFLVTGASVFLEVNTNTGDTNISQNGDDGIHIDTAGLTTDILINATNGNLLTINSNGANGVRWDVTDSLLGDNHLVTIDGVVIDGNAGDGIEFNVPVGSGALIVTNSAITNSGGDGMNINMTALGNVNGNSFGFGIVLVDNTVIDANSGHGVNIQIEGGDTDASATPLVSATYTNSQITNSGLNGVNIESRGSTGSRFFANEFVFTGNRIALNGQLGVVNQSHGIFYEANAGAITYTATGTLARRIPTVGGFDDGNNAGVPIDMTPIAPFLFGFNMGFNNPTFFTMSNYMNLLTENNATLEITNNIIEFNGPVPAAAGEGVFINVSTNSYVSAGVNGNTFTGNGSSDFRTRSFIATDAAGNPVPVPPSTQGGTPGGNDVVFLDNTAQLDLQLANNTGQNIQPVGPGAIYPAESPNKGFGGRNVQIFQVDDSAGGLDTNVFTNIPVTQQNLFLNAGYWTAATPWSLNNANFPQDFATNPGDPFLP